MFGESLTLALKKGDVSPGHCRASETDYAMVTCYTRVCLNPAMFLVIGLKLIPWHPSITDIVASLPRHIHNTHSSYKVEEQRTE